MAPLSEQNSLVVNGRELLFLFGILMILIAVYVTKVKDSRRFNKVKTNWIKVILVSLAVGFLSGFFGIGGGFLIVPGLMFSTGINITQAVGTSLLAVGSFGIVGALAYALSGYVDPIISVLYLVGGVVGGYLGTKIAIKLERRKLQRFFAVILIFVAIYIILKQF